MTFSTSDQSFYLPSSSQQLFCPLSRSRSVSPSGYNTDPEAEIRRFDRDIRSVPTDFAHTFDSYSRLSLSRRTRRTTAKTAGPQQLLQYESIFPFTEQSVSCPDRLAILQTCILDTEESLRVVVKEIDKLLSGCDATILVCYLGLAWQFKLIAVLMVNAPSYPVCLVESGSLRT